MCHTLEILTHTLRSIIGVRISMLCLCVCTRTYVKYSRITKKTKLHTLAASCEPTFLHTYRPQGNMLHDACIFIGLCTMTNAHTTAREPSTLGNMHLCMKLCTSISAPKIYAHMHIHNCKEAHSATCTSASSSAPIGADPCLTYFPRRT